jgi:hypothetical protein
VQVRNSISSAALAANEDQDGRPSFVLDQIWLGTNEQHQVLAWFVGHVRFGKDSEGEVAADESCVTLKG